MPPRGPRPYPRDLRDPRDPRARGFAEDDDEEQSSFGAGKALAIIVLAFVLGAGVAFGYFKISTPKVNTDSGTPAASPTAAPSTTASPHAFVISSDRYAGIQQLPPAL